MAFYDILCLITFILNAGLRFWLSPVPFQYTVYYPVTWPIQQIGHTGNTLCTVLLCFERYMEICLQEKARDWCTRGKTKLYLAFISLFCLLFNIPTFFELEWGAKGVKWTDLMSSRSATSYFVIYNVWLRLIIRCALPIISLVILSSLVVIKVISTNIVSCSLNPTTNSETMNPEFSRISELIRLLLRQKLTNKTCCNWSKISENVSS